MCGDSASATLLAEAKWYPYWDREGGACPACVQQNLLRTLLSKGDAALHEALQAAWPLDAEGAAFGVLPTRLRLDADPRFSGKGITIALVNAGFYPHPDLAQPRNQCTCLPGDIPTSSCSTAVAGSTIPTTRARRLTVSEV